MTNLKKIEIDDNGQWIEISGIDYGTGFNFGNKSIYCNCGGSKILDSDGCPLTEGDTEYIAVINAISKSNAASTLGKLGGSAKSEKKSASSRDNGAKGGRPKINWVEKIFNDYPLTARTTLNNLSNGEFEWEKLSENKKQIHAKQAYEILEGEESE